jgi:methionine-rich copper-binding protein CopC
MRTLRLLSLSAAFVLAASAAFAHAQLQKATPGVGSTVASASEVKLEFSEGVEPKFTTVAVTGPSGPIATAKPAIAGDAKVLVVKFAAPLPPGEYTVTWKAVSVDTHHTQGDFSFTVKP